MSYIRKLQDNGDICLYNGEGGSATLREEGEGAARLLTLFPEDDKALLSAAESEAARRGLSELFCDIPGEQSAVYEESGFQLKERDKIISINTVDLLNSAGVQKSLRMKFPDIETYSFYELMSFQLDEVKEFLEQLHFPISEERFAQMDENLSAVCYDKEYKLVSILLASRQEGEILVELLLGFSSKFPQYILSTCQRFVEGLTEEDLAEEYPAISMLTMNSAVIPLLRRLLNKEYEMTDKTVIVHATKAAKDNGETIEDGEAGDEAPLAAYRENINEKYAWERMREG
ncbi:MAG: hypothetical protein IK115_05890 [Lachnospiraceae bacterium]|nr:hypothetical protein [Lachnospiraceae bacterium]